MDMKVYFPGGKRVYADYGGFTIETDQPARGGGDDSAPAPFDLFLASIGTCAGIYVLSFLTSHGLPTEGVRLVQKMTYDDASHRMTQVGIQIVVPAGFPEKHRKALERSAELCAVKRAIANPPEFTVATVEG